MPLRPTGWRPGVETEPRDGRNEKSSDLKSQTNGGRPDVVPGLSVPGGAQ